MSRVKSTARVAGGGSFAMASAVGADAADADTPSQPASSHAVEKSGAVRACREIREAPAIREGKAIGEQTRSGNNAGSGWSAPGILSGNRSGD